MKNIKLILAAAVMALFASVAGAATIKSNLNRSIVIQLSGGRTITLLPKATAKINDSDLSSPGVARLIADRSISVLKTPKKKQ